MSRYDWPKCQVCNGEMHTLKGVQADLRMRIRQAERGLDVMDEIRSLKDLARSIQARIEEHTAHPYQAHPTRVREVVGE